MDKASVRGSYNLQTNFLICRSQQGGGVLPAYTVGEKPHQDRCTSYGQAFGQYHRHIMPYSGFGGASKKPRSCSG